MRTWARGHKHAAGVHFPDLIHSLSIIGEDGKLAAQVAEVLRRGRQGWREGGRVENVG